MFFLLNMIVGVPLLVISVILIWASTNWYGSLSLKSWIEKTFIEPVHGEGKDLFAKDENYSNTIFWFKWPAFFVAITTVIPLTLIWHDVFFAFVLGAAYGVAETVYWFARKQKARAKIVEAELAAAEK